MMAAMDQNEPNQQAPHRPPHREPIKPTFHAGTASANTWKERFREQCNERIRRDRQTHLWRRRSDGHGAPVDISTSTSQAQEDEQASSRYVSLSATGASF